MYGVCIRKKCKTLQAKRIVFIIHLSKGGVIYDRKEKKKTGNARHPDHRSIRLYFWWRFFHWIHPSGTYDYQEMNINGRIRNVAIDGTYHTIDKSEVTTTGFLGFFSVLYRGCVEAA